MIWILFFLLTTTWTSRKKMTSLSSLLWIWIPSFFTFSAPACHHKPTRRLRTRRRDRHRHYRQPPDLLHLADWTCWPRRKTSFLWSASKVKVQLSTYKDSHTKYDCYKLIKFQTLKHYQPPKPHQSKSNQTPHDMPQKPLQIKIAKNLTSEFTTICKTSHCIRDEVGAIICVEVIWLCRRGKVGFVPNWIFFNNNWVWPNLF